MRQSKAESPLHYAVLNVGARAAGKALGRGKGYLAARSAGKGSMPLWGQPGSGSLTIHPNGETSQAACKDGPQARWYMPGLAGAEACPHFSILLS